MDYSYLKSIHFIDEYKIECEFEDGNRGILDITQYLDRGGVFEKLRNNEYVKNISVINGVLAWGNGEIDIAPETIYHSATRKPLPRWMND